MSSIVCHGLQSCLEPRLIEPPALRLKLDPPKSFPWPQSLFAPRQQEHQESSHNEVNNNKDNNGCVDCDSKSNNNGEMGGWSFIQALTNKPHNCKEVTENEKEVYVHPLVKLSSSTLSKTSLEMCTESLGSETGSDISESSDEFSSVWPENSLRSNTIQQSKSRELGKKLTRSGSFPPPLTSISGSDSVRVRPHREGGRLVIKAVAVASCNGYFQAERVDGRLRLCLLKEGCVNCDNELVEGKEKVYNEEVGEGVVEEHASVGETKAKEEYYDVDDDDDDDETGGDDDDDNDKWVEGIRGKLRLESCQGRAGARKVVVGTRAWQVGGHFGWPLLKALC
ncbi:unnamed protein product [Camellia sinensis]